MLAVRQTPRSVLVKNAELGVRGEFSLEKTKVRRLETNQGTKFTRQQQVLTHVPPSRFPHQLLRWAHKEGVNAAREKPRLAG